MVSGKPGRALGKPWVLALTHRTGLLEWGLLKILCFVVGGRISSRSAERCPEARANPAGSFPCGPAQGISEQSQTLGATVPSAAEFRALYL